MTEEYRLKELDKAQIRFEVARNTYKTTENIAMKRQAAEAMEFWGNKAAFLANAKS